MESPLAELRTTEGSGSGQALNEVGGDAARWYCSVDHAEGPGWIAGLAEAATWSGAAWKADEF